MAKNGYDDTPLLPGGEWHVHDGARPQARVVTPGAMHGEAPSDAISLFNGTDLSGWSGRDGEAQWKVEGGYMEVAPKTGDIQTKEPLGDSQLHLEFACPAEVKGESQGRGNSGFYAHGRYEVQVLDSFGLNGEHNECGGIYTVAQPTVNMCFPPLQWQTYDVDFKGARFDADGKKTANARLTVKHNGVLIHDDVEADHSTTAAPLKEGPEPGPVYFQDHGNPVHFRNIWVVEKK